MAESLVNVNGLPLYTMDDGAISLTVMVTVAVELPPELLAVPCTVSGMRQPLVFLKWHRWSWKTGGLRAALGNRPETTVPPPALGVTVVMAVPLVE